MKSFASDNYSGIHSDIMKAIQAANINHAKAYGECEFTNRAIAKLKEHFGEDIDAYFVLSGTAANVTALHAVTRPYNCVICAQSAHINNSETGAPESMGCKIIGIEHTNGKICPKNILPHLKVMGDQHSAQPKVISITQPTELGTVYLPEEIKTLAELAHKHNMYLHIDGARLSNACVKLGKSFKEMTADCDIDILSFGGTKNGMMIGESVIFFNQKLSIDFQYVRKNMLQLYSKMRFIACQFEAFLSNDLWKLNAIHANIMAQKLENLLNQMPIIKITAPVETNVIFVSIPKNIIAPLQKKYHFYIWNEETYNIRLMTNFDTQDCELEAFCSDLRSLLSKN